jgi:hypothetical protein
MCRCADYFINLSKIVCNFEIMELAFDITESFNRDMLLLSASEKEVVKKQINLVSQSLLNGQTAFKENSSIPYIFNLKGGLDSSLFLIRADKDHRIIAAVDDDPIFEKVSLTLFRIVDKKGAETVYREVGEDIYKKLGLL